MRNFITLDDNNRIVGYRSGSYDASDKNDNEIEVKTLNWVNDRFCIYNIVTDERICDDFCKNAREFIAEKPSKEDVFTQPTEPTVDSTTSTPTDETTL